MNDYKKSPPGKNPPNRRGGKRENFPDRRPGEDASPTSGKEGGESEHNARPNRQSKDAYAASNAPRGATGALIELDRELMKLLVRRATLVSRIRGGRDHASSPAAVQAEKAVRIAWETGALGFSKDPRFSRQLFALLQDLKVMSKEQAGQAGSFQLSPPVRPVSGVLTGPTAVRTAQMRLALAACLGKNLRLTPIIQSEALNDAYRACEQAGAVLSRQSRGPGLGTVLLEAGVPPSLAGKSIYLGEDPFTMYLTVFLSLAKPGVCRLNGGARLKSADLSALRHALPLFGARLAHVVPHSQGLPANLECSGEIPPHVLVPAELPEEALCALLLAPLAWNIPVTLDLSALPAATATAALAEVRPLHRDAGAEVETYGPKINFLPGPVNPPEEPLLPLDPVLCAYLLCIPAFAGGTISLNGIWPSHMPTAAEAKQLFSWAGLDFTVTEHGVATSLPAPQDVATNQARQSFSVPMQNDEISPALGPLFLCLAALCLRKKGAVPPLGQLLAFPVEETDTALAQEFFGRIGMRYENDVISLQSDEGLSAAPSWTSPDAYWSMAYALAAYISPGLQLANPGNVTEIMPPFWGIYNSLPSPVDPTGSKAAKKEDSERDKPARRRIITD